MGGHKKKHNSSDSEDSLDDFVFDTMDDKEYSEDSEFSIGDESDSDVEDEDIVEEDLLNFWNPVPGNAEKVIASNSTVFAINSQNTLFEFNSESNTWTQVDTKPLIDVSINDDGSAYGVGRGNEIYRRSSSDAKWKKIKSKSKLIKVSSFDSHTAWGIDKNGNTCRWNGLTFTKIKLETKKKLKCITVGDSCVSYFKKN